MSGRGYGTAGPGPQPPPPPPPGVAFADFSPTELYTLMECVAANLSAINAGSRQLEKTLRQIGTPRDTASLRQKAQESQQSANASVAATTRDLKRLSVVVRRGDKRQKLQVEKLTQNFTESLAKYSSIQKQLSEKMQMYMPKTLTTELMSESAVGEEDDDTARLVAQKQAQARMLEFETGLLEEREAYVRSIEVNILDVNQIMRDLDIAIVAQGATIDTIESSIELAGARVESGTEELIKASQYQAKFRRKMLILVGIALIVGIILTIIIVTSLKR